MRMDWTQESLLDQCQRREGYALDIVYYAMVCNFQLEMSLEQLKECVEVVEQDKEAVKKDLQR